MLEPAQWRQIEELYHAALDLPENERAAFLTRACADGEVRREVESLLAARVEAGEFLAQPALDRSLPSGAQHAALTERLGSFIGHYKLLAVLGVGGMGEVFLAADTRLQRQVALKLLPPQFSQQPGRVRRFEQEARATTALNHPNIVTLYDTGQHAGAYFIVNEYVDGQTLREHLREKGTLSVNEALNLAQQIATALAAAHAAGIVHRDIKPENVMLRRDGFVKVLDFGLAKLTDTQPESHSAEDDTRADESTPLLPNAVRAPQSATAAGVLLGTIRYMSPEQAKGERVDARTDVFSLGVVLYEMLTGQTPFQRASTSETLAAILTAEPAALPAEMPAALQRLVLSALRKDREARLQTADELLAAVREIAAEHQFSARLAAVPVWRRLRWPVWVGACLLALAGYFAWPAGDSVESTILPQLKTSLVESWRTEPNSLRNVLSSSPDGRWLAFAKTQNGQADIYLKALSGGEARKLSDDAWPDFSPVWSPDGQRLAYLKLRAGQAEVRLVSAFGSDEQVLCTLAVVPTWLTSWTRDGTRIYYEAERNLYQLDVARGASRRVTDFPAHSTKEAFAVSADDEWLAYHERVANRLELFAVPLAGGKPVQVTHEGETNAWPLWLPDNQRLIYSSRRHGVRQLCVVSRAGGNSIQFSFGHESMVPYDVTPDGRKIFYLAEREEADIYLLDAQRGAERRFSTEFLTDLFPAIAPDGGHVAFQQSHESRMANENPLFSQALAGSAKLQLNENGFDVRWSPNGERLAFLREQNQDYQLWTVRRDGTEARLVVKEKVSFLGHAPRPNGWVLAPNYSWSPDGLRLSYGSTRGGQSNLYSIAAAGTDEQPLTNNRDAQLLIAYRDHLRKLPENFAEKYGCDWHCPEGNCPPCLGWKRSDYEEYLEFFEAG